MIQGKQSFVPISVGHAEVLRFGTPTEPRRMLDQIVRDRARQMLQAALEDEVNAFLEAHSSKTDGNGRRQVVRNGDAPTREIVTAKRLSAIHLSASVHASITQQCPA
jgi:tRNA A37 N6-isopentenylltransferase MiaA